MLYKEQKCTLFVPVILLIHCHFFHRGSHKKWNDLNFFELHNHHQLKNSFGFSYFWLSNFIKALLSHCLLIFIQYLYAGHNNMRNIWLISWWQENERDNVAFQQAARTGMKEVTKHICREGKENNSEWQKTFFIFNLF